jgi:hypothetical protein
MSPDSPTTTAGHRLFFTTRCWNYSLFVWKKSQTQAYQHIIYELYLYFNYYRKEAVLRTFGNSTAGSSSLIPLRGAIAPSWPGPPHCRGFTITLLSVGLLWMGDEPVAKNTHMRQTSMSCEGFEPTIPASERPQTHALDRAATGTGSAGR